MKVRELIQVLSALDWDQEILIQETTDRGTSAPLKNGCTIQEDVDHGHYVLCPNESGRALKNPEHKGACV